MRQPADAAVAVILRLGGEGPLGPAGFHPEHARGARPCRVRPSADGSLIWPSNCRTPSGSSLSKARKIGCTARCRALVRRAERAVHSLSVVVVVMPQTVAPLALIRTGPGLGGGAARCCLLAWHAVRMPTLSEDLVVARLDRAGEPFGVRGLSTPSVTPPTSASTRAPRACTSATCSASRRSGGCRTRATGRSPSPAAAPATSATRAAKRPSAIAGTRADRRERRRHPLPAGRAARLLAGAGRRAGAPAQQRRLARRVPPHRLPARHRQTLQREPDDRQGVRAAPASSGPSKASPSPSSATCCCRRPTTCTSSTSYGCRFQMGGSDQWGNITMGLDLIRKVRAAGSPLHSPGRCSCAATA